MSYKPSNPNGQATSANSEPVVIASDQSTIPVSLASVPSHAVTLASTTITGTVAVTDNAGSITVDAPVGTPAFVRLSDGAAAITTLPVSLASVPSHAVTNAGTFAVQVSSAPTTAVTGTFWQATQPVSGTVEIGATSLAALETTSAVQSGTWTVQPGNTANTTPWLTRINDGTNSAAIKAASTAAIATDPALVVAVSPNNSVAVTQAVAANLNATVTGTVELGATSLAALENISVTIPGTVDLGTVSLAALETITVTQTTPANFQSKAYGAVTTAAPTYTTGTDNTLSLTTGGALRVDVMSALPAGTNAIGKLSANDGVDIGDVTINNASIAVTGTFWQATQPVSIASMPSTAVTNIGTFAVQAAQSGTWNIGSITTLPTLANVTTVGTVSAITAGPAIGSGFYVRNTDGTNTAAVKAPSTAAIATDPALVVAISPNNTVPVSLASVPSHAVTNAGTFAVQVTSAPTTAVTGTFWQATQPVSIATLPTLAAGTNNIGDVDILSVIPGTGATNLGKQTDSAAGGTDTGVAILAIRDDALTTLTPIDGDYTRFRVNSVGRLWTSATIDAALPAGSNAIGSITNTSFAATQSGTWNIGSITTLPTLANVTTVGTVSAITAGPAIGSGFYVRNTDGTNTAAVKAASTAAIATDPALVVAISPNNTVPVSLASVPSHAVTLASTTITGTVAVTDNAGSLTIDAPVGTPAFVRLSDGAAAITTLPVSLASVPSHAVTNAGTFAVQVTSAPTTAVTGTFWQATQPVSLASVPSHAVTNAGTFAVQVSTALPAGTNNIGDVDVLSVIPGTGATNLGKQTDSAAGGTDTGVAVLAIRDDVLTTLTPADGDYTRFRVNSIGQLHTAATLNESLGTATAIAALNGTVSLALSGNTGAAVTVTVIAAPVGFVVTPYVSYDGGTNWTVTKFYDPINELVENTIVNASLAVGFTRIILAADGATNVRVQATGWTSGSATFRLSASNAAGVVNIKSNAVHDAASGTYMNLVGGYASSTAPTAVVNGDAARLWTTLNGAVNIADGAGSITVDGTFWQATQPVSIATMPSTPVTGTFWQATQPVSGTITANIAAAQTLATVTTVGAVTSITNALPAGTNAIGKLAANSGVDIGDVDILSIIPGTGATNLGKQTDSAAGGTDTGVAILAIRDDALTTLTPIDGDYTRFRVNSVGRLWTSATIDAALPTGANVIGAVTQSGTWNIGSITTLPTLANVTTVGTVTTITTANLAADDVHDSAAGTTAVMMGGYAYGVAAADNTLPVVSTNADAARILTNKNGGLVVVQLPEATQAYAPTNATTTAYATSLVVKASAGTLYILTGYNSNTVAQFIQVHDASSLPADAAVPKVIFYVPPLSNFSYDLGSYGRYFAVGIVVCNSTTGPTKTIGAANCWFDVQYK